MYKKRPSLEGWPSLIFINDASRQHLKYFQATIIITKVAYFLYFFCILMLINKSSTVTQVFKNFYFFENSEFIFPPAFKNSHFFKNSKSLILKKENATRFHFFRTK